MKKHLLVILAIITVVMSFKTNNGGLKVDTSAPEFSMKDINGAVVKLSDYRGKVVLISFWASWCKQCRAESPKLVKSYQRFQNAKFQDGNGFVVRSFGDRLEKGVDVGQVFLRKNFLGVGGHGTVGMPYKDGNVVVGFWVGC